MTGAPPPEPSRRLHAAAIALVAASAAVLTVLLANAPQPSTKATELPTRAITARTTGQLPSAGSNELMSPPLAWQTSSRSEPVSFDIAAVGLVNVPVDELGQLMQASTSDEPDAAVLAGAASGKLARLSEVRIGDRVTVRRADGATEAFTVARVQRPTPRQSNVLVYLRPAG